MDKQQFVSTLERCIAAGISASELANKFKVSEATIGRWQKGQIPDEPVRSTVEGCMQSMLQQHA